MDAAKPLGSEHPGRGDIVFFNKTAHVALSLGSRLSNGDHEVMSLFNVPPTPDGMAFVSTLQRTTIEKLIEGMRTYLGMSSSVTFAPNPF
jgi:hypothetical protein